MVGKTVVDSDLSPYKITTHACVDCSLSINCYSQQKNKKIVGYNAKFNTILLLSLALTLIQIV
jgi:cytochrome c oxidase assembly protein subunit 15